MNLTDYSKTAIYRAFEMVRFEAKRYGVSIIGSEIVGLVPMEALIDTASYYGIGKLLHATSAGSADYGII